MTAFPVSYLPLTHPSALSSLLFYHVSFSSDQFVIPRENSVAHMPMDDFCPAWSGGFSGIGNLLELERWEQPDFFRKSTRLNPSGKREWCEPWSPHLDVNSHTICEVLGPMGQSMSETKHHHLPLLSVSRLLSQIPLF